MPSLKMTGKNLQNYVGMDTGIEPPVHVTLKPGMIAQFSDKKAEQLLRDYPNDFAKVAGSSETPEPAKEPEPQPEPFRALNKPTGKKPKKNKALTPKRNKKG